MKDRRLRMMFLGNIISCSSGYGVYLRDLLAFLVAEGFPVAQVAYYGLEGAPIDYKGVKIYPKMGSTWGDDAVVFDQDDFQSHCIISMMDVWVLDPNLLRKFRNYIAYVPIDHTPPPPTVVDRLRYCYKIITFSRFGQKELQKVGFTSTLILEGTNCDIFKPMDKIEARKQLKLPQDKFVFGMIGANKDNPPRKGFQQAMDAFKMFHDKHPEAGLFIHTLLQQQGGFPIMYYARFLGIENSLYAIPDYQVLVKAQHPEIALEMNAIDCLLQSSTNEGFGLPIIEAQSCGKPVIVNNFSSMPELVIEGKTGFITEIYQKWFTPLQGYACIPDTKNIYDNMEKLYAWVKKDNGQIAKDCRENILTNYNNESIFKDKWLPTIEQIQLDLLGPVK